MAKLRVTIDLAFPYPLTDEFRTRLEAIGAQIHEARAAAVKINEGKPNEEATVRASYHICHNDEVPNIPCEPDVEI